MSENDYIKEVENYCFQIENMTSRSIAEERTCGT